jgi:hypothetical protein
MWCKGACGKHCPLHYVVLWCSLFSLLLTWVASGRGHHYWIIFKHEEGGPLRRSFICFGPLSSSPKNHYVSPQLLFSIPSNILGPMSEITHAFDQLLTQFAPVGLGVKMSKCKLWNPSKIFLDIEIVQGSTLVTNGYAFCVCQRVLRTLPRTFWMRFYFKTRHVSMIFLS